MKSSFSGKKVYVASDKNKALDTLRISCDKYFEISIVFDIHKRMGYTGSTSRKKPLLERHFLLLTITTSTSYRFGYLHRRVN